MSNHSLVSGSPVLPVLCWNWDRPAAPVHTNHSDTSEAWIGNSVSYLQTFSNITQIFTHFLQVLMVYKKVYNVSRKYQENWNKEHSINNQQKSHPFNVSDKYHVCLGSSTIKTELQASKQQASEQVQAAAAVIKHYHHQGETWKPKLKSLKKCVEPKWNSDNRTGPAGADAPSPRIVCKDRFDPGVGAWVSMTPSACETSRQRVFDEIASNAS